MDDLEAGTRVDRDEYPKAMSTMYELMIKYTSSIQSSNESQGSRRRDAITLLQATTDEEDSTLIPGTDGQTNDIKCFNCNQRGHYASNCPESRVGISNLQYGNIFTQVQESTNLIPSNWILLDTCSTDNVVNNELLIEDKRDCNQDESLQIYTNGGSLFFGEIGRLKYLPLNTYYNPHSIANVLLLKAVDDIHGLYLTMDTKISSGIFIEDGVHKLHFEHSPSGLYYCTIEDMEVFFSARQRGNHVSLLTSSTSEHTNEEIVRAREARHLQECLMWPSDGELKRILSTKVITGSNITHKDEERAKLIFGKAKEISAGKMTAPVKTQNLSS